MAHSCTNEVSKNVDVIDEKPIDSPKEETEATFSSNPPTNVQRNFLMSIKTRKHKAKRPKTMENHFLRNQFKRFFNRFGNSTRQPRYIGHCKRWKSNPISSSLNRQMHFKLSQKKTANILMDSFTEIGVERKRVNDEIQGCILPIAPSNIHDTINDIEISMESEIDEKGCTNSSNNMRDQMVKVTEFVIEETMKTLPLRECFVRLSRFDSISANLRGKQDSLNSPLQSSDILKEEANSNDNDKGCLENVREQNCDDEIFSIKETDEGPETLRVNASSIFPDTPSLLPTPPANCHDKKHYVVPPMAITQTPASMTVLTPNSLTHSPKDAMLLSSGTSKDDEEEELNERTEPQNGENNINGESEIDRMLDKPIGAPRAFNSAEDDWEAEWEQRDAERLSNSPSACDEKPAGEALNKGNEKNESQMKQRDECCINDEFQQKQMLQSNPIVHQKQVENSAPEEQSPGQLQQPKSHKQTQQCQLSPQRIQQPVTPPAYQNSPRQTQLQSPQQNQQLQPQQLQQPQLSPQQSQQQQQSPQQSPCQPSPHCQSQPSPNLHSPYQLPQQSPHQHFQLSPYHQAQQQSPLQSLHSSAPNAPSKRQATLLPPSDTSPEPVSVPAPVPASVPVPVTCSASTTVSTEKPKRRAARGEGGRSGKRRQSNSTSKVVLTSVDPSPVAQWERHCLPNTALPKGTPVSDGFGGPNIVFNQRTNAPEPYTRMQLHSSLSHVQHLTYLHGQDIPPVASDPGSRCHSLPPPYASGYPGPNPRMFWPRPPNPSPGVSVSPGNRPIYSYPGSIVRPDYYYREYDAHTPPGIMQHPLHVPQPHLMHQRYPSNPSQGTFVSQFPAQGATYPSAQHQGSPQNQPQSQTQQHHLIMTQHHQFQNMPQHRSFHSQTQSEQEQQKVQQQKQTQKANEQQQVDHKLHPQPSSQLSPRVRQITSQMNPISSQYQSSQNPQQRQSATPPHSQAVHCHPPHPITSQSQQTGVSHVHHHSPHSAQPPSSHAVVGLQHQHQQIMTGHSVTPIYCQPHPHANTAFSSSIYPGQPNAAANWQMLDSRHNIRVSSPSLPIQMEGLQSVGQEHQVSPAAHPRNNHYRR